MKEKSYFIKAGYVARDTAETVEEVFGDYWTETRIKVAHELQWYVYRHALWLARLYRLKSVADVGCGYPAKLAMFRGYDITVFDQKTTVSALASRFPDYSWYAQDLANPPQDTDKKFDLVICSDVIEHLLDPDPLVERIRKSTGKFAVISTPERDYRRGFDNMRSPKSEHVREWNQKEFKSYLEASGLKVVSHRLYPQTQIPLTQFMKSQAFGIRNKKLSSCQVAVCRVA